MQCNLQNEPNDNGASGIQWEISVGEGGVAVVPVDERASGIDSLEFALARNAQTFVIGWRNTWAKKK